MISIGKLNLQQLRVEHRVGGLAFMYISLEADLTMVGLESAPTERNPRAGTGLVTCMRITSSAVL